MILDNIERVEKFDKEEKKLFAKAEKEYVVLIGTGMFWEFFPDYSGDWEQDKNMFLEFYKNRENKVIK